LVAAFEAFNGKRKPAELVLAIRVGAGDVEQQMGREVHRHLERATEAIEIFAISDAVTQIDVDHGRRFLAWIVIELVQRKREHAAVARENRGGAVAVVNVAIDDQGSFDQAFVL
jgi:hypothetical protein